MLRYIVRITHVNVIILNADYVQVRRFAPSYGTCFVVCDLDCEMQSENLSNPRRFAWLRKAASAATSWIAYASDKIKVLSLRRSSGDISTKSIPFPTCGYFVATTACAPILSPSSENTISSFVP